MCVCVWCVQCISKNLNAFLFNQKKIKINKKQNKKPFGFCGEMSQKAKEMGHSTSREVWAHIKVVPTF